MVSFLLLTLERTWLICNEASTTSTTVNSTYRPQLLRHMLFHDYVTLGRLWRCPVCGCSEFQKSFNVLYFSVYWLLNLIMLLASSSVSAKFNHKLKFIHRYIVAEAHATAGVIHKTVFLVQRPEHSGENMWNICATTARVFCLCMVTLPARGCY